MVLVYSADSGKLPIRRDPPTSSHRNEILRGGWSSDDSSKFRISSKSVKRFRSCGGSKFAHPHWLGHWLIQQAVMYMNQIWLPDHYVTTDHTWYAHYYFGRLEISFKNQRLKQFKISSRNFAYKLKWPLWTFLSVVIRRCSSIFGVIFDTKTSTYVRKGQKNLNCDI